MLPVSSRYRPGAGRGEKLDGSRWVLALASAAGVLLIPAILNGFPFVFADTGGYLARPFEATPALGRSALYGAFLAAGIPLDFWPNVILQAAASAFVVGVAVRACGNRRPAAFFLVVVALAVLTSLPWYAGQLMPDVFLPLAVLAVHLLAFAHERLRTSETLLLAAILAFAMASHMSIVAVVAALLALFCAVKLVGAWFGLARPRLAVPAGAAIAGIALALLSNLAIIGQLRLTPGGTTFLFGRLVQDGIVSRFLEERCPDPTLRLCAFRAELPGAADDWLWGKSPLGRLGGWEAFEPEARRIILNSMMSYPFMHIAAAARATAEQLVTLATGEGLGSKDNWHAEGVLRQYAPAAMPRFAASRQQHDAFDFRFVNSLHVPLAIAAAAILPVLIVFVRRRRPQLSTFAATVLFAIVINAAICGMFSNPNARYQSRIAPLATLTVLLAVIDLLKKKPTQNGMV
jgi:hypothetical protein